MLSDAAGKHVEHDEIQFMGEKVRQMLHDSLDAFARLRHVEARRVARRDKKIDRQYESILRNVMTYMMEDPRTITHSMNIIWAARALERIGDHAENICEYIIYLVEGKDVRHTDYIEQDED